MLRGRLAVEHAAGQPTDRLADPVIIGPEVEQGPPRGAPGDAGEDRHARRPRRADHGVERREHRVVAADPDRLGPPADERGDRLADGRRAIDVRLEQLDPQLLADGPGELRAGFRVRLRRVPGDPDPRQSRGEPPGHPERLGHRLHRPEADHVGGVLHRVVPRDADAGHDRVAHHPEDVRALRVPVGRGHRLEAGRRQGDDQLVVTPDDRPGDRIRRRGVSLGVVPADPDRPALLVPRLRQPRQHAPDPLLDGRLRDVLEQRDRANPPGRLRAIADDPAPPRGRSRSVSSKTADAATIKSAASHNRRKLLIIRRSGRVEEVQRAESGGGFRPAGHRSQASRGQPGDPEAHQQQAGGLGDRGRHDRLEGGSLVNDVITRSPLPW